jgi:hypothetical protein
MNRRKFLTGAVAAGIAVPAIAMPKPRTPLALAPLPFRQPDPALFEAIRQLEDNMRMASYRGHRSGPTSAQFRAAFEPGIRAAHEAVYDKYAAEWILPMGPNGGGRP